MRRALLLGAVAAATWTTRPGLAQAPTLRVIAGQGIAPALDALAQAFAERGGARITFFYGAAPQVTAELNSGRPFDLGIVPTEILRDAGLRARFAPGVPTDIVRAGYGVAVRAGTPRPDIASPEALRAALLAARSVATIPDSAAGAFVLGVFDRLGIGEPMRAKIVPQTTPPGIVAAVAGGQAEMGVFLSNVLAAPGLDLVGPFPPALQSELVYTAALAASAEQAAAAQGFVAFLRGPEAVAAFRARGLTPA